jgi:sigma-E factor negative regulatory protein RseA
MNTNTMSREQISALIDNELADSQIDIALAALRQPDQQAAWDIYHQIGDVLRSDDMAISMRPDFAARMAARLDAEPAIIAPSLAGRSASRQQAGASREAGLNRRNNRLKRFGLPGVVAAAAASVALITGPQLMVAMKGSTSQDNPQVMMASTSQPVSGASMVAASASQSAVVVPVASGNGTILRDPHIDEYLRAHQRFSPSVYSSAQLARSATLAHDSDK